MTQANLELVRRHYAAYDRGDLDALMDTFAPDALIVSGDEAASNADVRALAELANRVVVLTMFHELAGGWADLILPSTAALLKTEQDARMIRAAS